MQETFQLSSLASKTVVCTSTSQTQGALNTSVALPVKGPPAGKLPGLRISENATESLPELLLIEVLKEPPTGTTEVPRVMVVARLALLVPRALELNEEAVPLHEMSMPEKMPGEGHV